MGRPYEIRPIEDMKIPIWEHQSGIGETTEFYSMFLTYRNIRPADRSITNAHRVWTKGTQSEKKQISTLFYDVAKAFLWEERAATYDVSMLQDRYKKWGERDWMLRDEVWDAGEKIHKKAVAALDKIKDEDLNLSLPEIAALLKMSTELRLGAIPGIGTLNTNQIREVLSAMPESKRDAVLRIVVAEWKQISPGDTRAGSLNMADGNTIEGEVVSARGSVVRSELIEQPKVLYPDYIERRLLAEALTKVKSRATRKKLQTGELTWRDFLSLEEAQDIANNTRRPRGTWMSKQDIADSAAEATVETDA